MPGGLDSKIERAMFRIRGGGCVCVWGGGGGGGRARVLFYILRHKGEMAVF